MKPRKPFLNAWKTGIRLRVLRRACETNGADEGSPIRATMATADLLVIDTHGHRQLLQSVRVGVGRDRLSEAEFPLLLPH